jgi:hypothetical protein
MYCFHLQCPIYVKKELSDINFLLTSFSLVTSFRRNVVIPSSGYEVCSSIGKVTKVPIQYPVSSTRVFRLCLVSTCPLTRWGRSYHRRAVWRLNPRHSMELSYICNYQCSRSVYVCRSQVYCRDSTFLLLHKQPIKSESLDLKLNIANGNKKKISLLSA